MAYGDQLGGRSVTTFYKREQDKLANEFIPKTNLVAGVTVALNADGQVEELTDENKANYIGVNLYDVKALTLTTVMVLVSHVMMYGQAKEALKPGDKVMLSGVNGDHTQDETSYDYSNHLAISKSASGSVATGICLDSAESGQNEVRVLVYDMPVTVA